MQFTAIVYNFMNKIAETANRKKEEVHGYQKTENGRKRVVLQYCSTASFLHMADGKMAAGFRPGRGNITDSGSLCGSGCRSWCLPDSNGKKERPMRKERHMKKDRPNPKEVKQPARDQKAGGTKEHGQWQVQKVYLGTCSREEVAGQLLEIYLRERNASFPTTE